MLVHDLIHAMERLAPIALAEPWDNVGLLLGDPEAELRGPVLLTIDLTEAVASEAVELGAGVVISYHPPIFAPIKRLTAAGGHGRALWMLASRGVAVYSPHTALDAAPGGLTEWFVRELVGANAEVQAIEPRERPDPLQPLKLITFVPEEHADRVRSALASAGAGRIGLYDQCAFVTAGTGSFRGGASAKPAVGQAGRLEFVPEMKLEMVCGRAELPAVIAALRRVHPYEEPAFEVHALEAKPDLRSGAGRLARLAAPVPLAELAERVKRLTRSAVLAAAPARWGDRLAKSARPIDVVACVPGSGASLCAAAIQAGAACFVTGEMKHHEVLDAIDYGCAVILAGHTETERPYLPVLARRLEEALPGARCAVSTHDAAPLSAIGAAE